MNEKYKAIDDDLPEIFWSDIAESYPPPKDDSLLAVQLHYPEIKLTAKQKREVTKDQAERNSGLGTRKSYVRLSKKIQMFDWLRSLEATIPGMNEREADFCRQLLDKFRKWTPYGVKWVTVPQYNWLNRIAAKYIHLPKVIHETSKR